MTSRRWRVATSRSRMKKMWSTSCPTGQASRVSPRSK